MPESLHAALSLASPLFLILLGALVFAARPSGALHRVAGAYLLLRGGMDLMWHAMWYAPDAARALAAARTAVAYELGLPILLLLLVHHIDASPRWPRARRVLLSLVALATLGAGAAFAAEPARFVAHVDMPPGGARWRMTGGEWGAWAGLAQVVAQAAVVLACARLASSPERTVMARRHAGLVGLSFAVLTAHTGMFLAWDLDALLRGGAAGAIVLASHAVPFVATLAALRRLLRAVEPGERRFAGAVLVVAFAVVPLEIGLRVAREFWGLDLAWPWWRILLATTSAGILAVALVRLGLAGLGDAARRRIELLAHASLLGVALALPAALVFLALGRSNQALTFTLLFALVGVTLVPRPLRRVAVAAGRLLTIDAREDAGAAAERVLRYVRALEARDDHRADDAALVALRRELGLTLDDHARLAALALDRRAGSRAAEGAPLLGRYRVEREIGRGGFATALLAKDVVDGRAVVLKRYHVDADHRALEEARLLQRVHHPNVIPLLAVERVGAESFLVFPHVAGGSLHGLLQREGPLAPQRALRIALDILDGLAALHDVGLAHRDVKPTNILLDEKERAMLADLGASRPVAPRDEEATMTRSPVIGSYATVPPEVLLGRPCGPAGDVYSAAAVVYEMLTGQTYVELDGRSPAQLPHVVLHHAPRLPHARVPEDVARVLARALEKDPAARHPDARALRVALAACA